MIRTLLAAALLCTTSSACSETSKVSDDLAAAQTDAANPTGRGERSGANPAEKPVRIGEGGPRFDACQAVGKVSATGGGKLDVKISPFDSAESKGELAAGQLVYICTRSHDQQWLGIVYAGAGAPTALPATDNETADAAEEVSAPAQTKPSTPGFNECGVSSPVRSKRNYDGPCKSGWVESNFVKLIAG